MTTLTWDELRRQLLLERHTPDRDRGRTIGPAPKPADGIDLSPLIALLADNLTDATGQLLPVKPATKRARYRHRRTEAA